MSPDWTGSKAHALFLGVLEHGTSHDEVDLPEGCITSGKSTYVSKTFPRWPPQRHCSSHPPFAIPITEIASKCFHSSTPGESQDCSSAKDIFMSSSAMTLSKRLIQENAPSAPVPISLSPTFTTCFWISACDDLQKFTLSQVEGTTLLSPTSQRPCFFPWNLALYLVALVLALKVPKANLPDWFKAVSYNFIFCTSLARTNIPYRNHDCSQAPIFSLTSRSGHILLGTENVRKVSLVMSSNSGLRKM